MGATCQLYCRVMWAGCISSEEVLPLSWSVLQRKVFQSLEDKGNSILKAEWVLLAFSTEHSDVVT